MLTIQKEEKVGLAGTFFDLGDRPVCKRNNLDRSVASCFNMYVMMDAVQQLNAEMSALL